MNRSLPSAPESATAMDNITHTMAGAVLAHAGLDRGGKLPLAAPTLMLGANAPDIDVFVLFAGSYAGIDQRRSQRHSGETRISLCDTGSLRTSEAGRR